MRYTIAAVLVLCGCIHGIQDNPTIYFRSASVFPDTVPAGGTFTAHATTSSEACGPEVHILYGNAEHYLRQGGTTEFGDPFDSGALTAYAGDTVVTFTAICGPATAGPINVYLHVT